jgi:hypothetical protein
MGRSSSKISRTMTRAANPIPPGRQPVLPTSAVGGFVHSLADRLEAEIVQLKAARRLWVAQHGRTTVGVSGLAIAEYARSVADWLRGEAPLMMRFAVDDVKAYCLEAAAAGATNPSSWQLCDWFWNQTATGAAIYSARSAAGEQGRTAETDRREFFWCRRCGLGRFRRVSTTRPISPCGSYARMSGLRSG